jgi:glycosyltransferase involved in cell wall biosynthesis
MRRQRWLTNLSLIADCSFGEFSVDVQHLRGLRDSLPAALKLHSQSLRADVVLLYYPPGRLGRWLCALRWLTLPWNSSLVFADVVFTKPRPGITGLLVARLKRILLKRVDLFLVHMKDVSPLRAHYGIGVDRCRFVPYKVNPPARSKASKGPTTGECVLTAGRSRRDFSTFCLAMKDLPYSAIILTPQPHEAAPHETYLDRSLIPPNVRVVHDDGSVASWLESLARAKLVVLTIAEDAISPAGIGTYLEAMALGKCVIITECPATRGIIENGQQALVVPPRNVAALRGSIRRAWEDDSLRTRVAEAGRQYALLLGDEKDLNQRFVNAVLEYRRDLVSTA